MLKRHKILSFSLVVILLSGVGLLVHLIAEPDFHKGGGPGRRGGNNSIQKIGFQPASEPSYKTTCEGCHSPYPPELLPGSSWKIILNRLDDHFGEQVSVDPKSKEVLGNYLTENGADRSSSKKSVKIMKSLNGQTPLRITEIPYIQKKHRGIKPEILSRKSISSLSNCTACHKTADQGNFDEDRVLIPQ